MVYTNGSPDLVFTGGRQSIRTAGKIGEGVFRRRQC